MSKCPGGPLIVTKYLFQWDLLGTVLYTFLCLIGLNIINYFHVSK